MTGASSQPRTGRGARLAVGVAARASASGLLAASLACAPLPHLCESAADCKSPSSCVAGRCLPAGTTAAIDSARRWIAAPVDVAVLAPGRGGELGASIAILGKDDRSLALFRFVWPWAADAEILEAYLVLPLATSVDADPDSIALRAVFVEEPWRGATVTWARQPLLRESGAPITRVRPEGRGVVRLDVRTIVQRWMSRPQSAYGLAVVASSVSATGIAFAIAPTFGGARPEVGVLGRVAAGQGPAANGAQREPPPGTLAGPWLEVYAK